MVLTERDNLDAEYNRGYAEGFKDGLLEAGRDKGMYANEQHIKEKARQDFEDSLKEKCEGCGEIEICDQYGLCEDCANVMGEDDEFYDDELGVV